MAVIVGMCLVHGAAHATHCEDPLLLHQRSATATIERLEQAWTRAFLGGDTDLERCILSNGFTEILRIGQVKFLQDELGFAVANMGRRRAVPNYPKGTVLLHGKVAVAYGTTSATAPDGSRREIRYADYFVWDTGAVGVRILRGRRM